MRRHQPANQSVDSDRSTLMILKNEDNLETFFIARPAHGSIPSAQVLWPGKLV
jgi:hypothetical protein